jgi:hypothetical protein
VLERSYWKRIQNVKLQIPHREYSAKCGVPVAIRSSSPAISASPGSQEPSARWHSVPTGNHRLLKREHLIAGDIRYVGKETDRKWEEGEDVRVLDFAATEYGRSGKGLASEDVKVDIGNIGIETSALVKVDSIARTSFESWFGEYPFVQRIRALAPRVRIKELAVVLEPIFPKFRGLRMGGPILSMGVLGILRQLTKGRSRFDLPFEKCLNHLPTKTP